MIIFWGLILYSKNWYTTNNNIIVSNVNTPNQYKIHVLHVVTILLQMSRCTVFVQQIMHLFQSTSWFRKKKKLFKHTSYMKHLSQRVSLFFFVCKRFTNENRKYSTVSND